MQNTHVDDDTLIKADKSPVTGSYVFLSPKTRLTETSVADLSAQALISLHLLHHFSSDLIIGEEDTSELRANEGLRGKVITLVNEGFGRENGWGKGQTFQEEE